MTLIFLHKNHLRKIFPEESFSMKIIFQPNYVLWENDEHNYKAIFAKKWCFPGLSRYFQPAGRVVCPNLSDFWVGGAPERAGKKRLLNVIVIGQRLEQTTDRTSTNFRSEDSTDFSSLISKVLFSQVTFWDCRENEVGPQRRFWLLHADNDTVRLAHNFSHRSGWNDKKNTN